MTAADYRRLPYGRSVDKLVEEGQAHFVAFESTRTILTPC